LFFAVELPPEVQASLGRVRPSAPWASDYRWVEPSLMHVTLAFLGDQPASALDTLKQVASAAAQQTRTGTLALGPLGRFGGARAPRVLWVGLAGDLHALNGAQAQLASGLRGAGFHLEDRPFQPHITLARRRASAPPGPPPAWPPSIPPSARFRMDHVTLFESRLSPAGAHYTPLDEFPLRQS
jgi:2'-5' RNA ligase